MKMQSNREYLYYIISAENGIIIQEQRVWIEKVEKSGEEWHMNCKKYRACLVGLIAVALICGMFLYIRYDRDKKVPAEGVLVENSEDWGDVWA